MLLVPALLAAQSNVTAQHNDAARRARPVLCAAGRVLHGQPNGDAMMRAPNDVLTALALRSQPA